jgi:hypothetical protein
MVETREIEPKRITEWNYLPLLLEYFRGSTPQLARFMGIVLLWGVSGQPKLAEFALHNRLGLSKSTVYRAHDQAVAFHKWLAERGYQFADEWEVVRSLLRWSALPMIGKQA